MLPDSCNSRLQESSSVLSQPTADCTNPDLHSPYTTSYESCRTQPKGEVTATRQTYSQDGKEGHWAYE
jgi:hypothetical protein